MMEYVTVMTQKPDHTAEAHDQLQSQWIKVVRHRGSQPSPRLSFEDKPNWEEDFPVIGEGTVIFNVQRSTPFRIQISPRPIPDQCISLEVHKTSANFKIRMDGRTTTLKTVHDKTKRGETVLAVGYEENRKVSYWFSYDRSLLMLKYGKGYRMTETTLMEYSFLDGLSPVKQSEERKRLHIFFSAEVRRVIKQFDIKDVEEVVQGQLLKGMHFGEDGSNILPSLLQFASAGVDTVNAVLPLDARSKLDYEAMCVSKSMIDMEGKVDFDKHPFTCNWPPFVLDSSRNTLFELDSNNFTFSASLPSACQELYHNVVQEGVYLDWPPGLEQYKLSDAIRHSLDSKNGLLHKKLVEKENEFGKKAPKETYLRVTLGNYRGNSPGIPYVLEIWPKDHGSPIHNHGNAYAVIKVLHGGLTIHVYNKHTDSPENKELFNFDVKEGDVTWISPNWYQTHKLWNSTNDYCATIQCYQYGDNDNLHWPYFDYVKTTRTIDEFLPNSDFTFREMREKVLKEYMESQKKN